MKYSYIPQSRYKARAPSRYSWKKAARNYKVADEASKKITGKRIHTHIGEKVKSYGKKWIRRKPNPEAREQLKKWSNYYENEEKKTARRAPRKKNDRTVQKTSQGKVALNVRVRPVSNGSSISKYYEPAGYSRFTKYYRVSPQQYFQFDSTQQITTTVGQQSYTYFGVFTKTDLTTMASFVDDNGTTTTPAKRFMLNNCTEKVTMTNMSSANSYVDIYEWKCRRETSSNPLLAWDTGSAHELITGASTGVAADGTKNIGTNPFQSNYFCCRYLIKRVLHLELAPGRTHMHISKYPINQYFNYDAFDVTESDEFQENLTRGIMVVAWGGASQIVGTPGTTGVTTADIKIDLIRTATYTFRYLYPSSTKYILKDVLQQTGSVQVMDEATDTVKTNTSA